MSLTYFAMDRAAGELDFFDTEQAAFDYAAETLKEYRRDARADGEWSLDVEDVTVGVVPVGVTQQAARDDDRLLCVTHRAKAIGNKKMGYDYRMCLKASAELTDEVQK